MGIGFYIGMMSRIKGLVEDHCALGLRETSSIAHVATGSASCMGQTQGNRLGNSQPMTCGFLVGLWLWVRIS